MELKSKAGINYLTEKEEKVLFSYLKNRKDKQAERDYVLLKLCRSTGLRRGEALALNIIDVMGKDRITIDERIAEKGATGEVYLPVEMQEIMKRFMRLKREWGESLEDDSPSLLVRKAEGYPSGPLTTVWINGAVSRECRDIPLMPYDTPRPRGS